MSTRPSDAAHRTAPQQSHLAQGAGWLGPLTSNAHIYQPSTEQPALASQSSITYAHDLQPSRTSAPHHFAGRPSLTAGWLPRATFSSASVGAAVTATCSRPLGADAGANQHPTASQPSTTASSYMYVPGPMHMGQQLLEGSMEPRQGPELSEVAAASAATAPVPTHPGVRRGAGWL
jgi:hypothetical protein